MTPEDRARLAHYETEPDDVIEVPVWIGAGIFAAAAIGLLAILLLLAAWAGLIA